MEEHIVQNVHEGIKMKIERDEECASITMILDDGSCLTAGSVEANLLYSILEKLEEIRCGLIDVEEEVESLKKSNSLQCMKTEYHRYFDLPVCRECASLHLYNEKFGDYDEGNIIVQKVCKDCGAKTKSFRVISKDKFDEKVQERS